MFPQTKEDFEKKYSLPKTIWSTDIYAPVYPDYLEVSQWASSIQRRGYQLGTISDDARKKFAETFSGDPDSNQVAVFFCPSGTAANAVLRGAVLNQNTCMLVTHEMSHANDREANSAEAMTGARVLKPFDILTSSEYISWKKTNDFIPPKLLDEAISRRIATRYITQELAIISLSIPAEDGRIPSVEYLHEIGLIAKKYNLLYQIDGARLLIASAATEKTIKELTTDIGADLVSVGGSKVGLHKVDSAVFTPNFFSKYGTHHTYKNTSESFSKFRSILKRMGALNGQSECGSAQFIKCLTDNFGVSVAEKAIKAAHSFAKNINDINGCYLYQPVQSNVVLVSMPVGMFRHLEKSYEHIRVYLDQDPNVKGNIVIWFMTNWSISDEDIHKTVECLREYEESNVKYIYTRAKN